MEAIRRSAIFVLLLNLLVGCSTPQSAPPPLVTYTIGGTVVNLAGTNLVLQDNGGDNLTMNANGNFTFPKSVASGGAFVVTVLTQPSAPAQTCGVVNGGGTATANVTNVIVNCGAHGQWAWMSGSNVVNQSGIYGRRGTPAGANVPGARDRAVGWTDTSGNRWLFGGFGFDSAGMLNYLNDLWKYSISSGQWIWTSGSNLAEQSGTYGTVGTSAPGNVPGAREASVSWIDLSGNLWLFGGDIPSLGGPPKHLNDLWEYNVSSGQWTWMTGSSLTDQPGTYGTLGMPAPANVPGARDHAVSWNDTSGNLWLFGGIFFDPAGAGTLREMNDLWKYNISSGQWTWVSGSNLTDQPGTYGTLGISAPGNVPGAREGSVSWIDMSQNLWLFGGTDNLGRHNDLWMYTP